MRTPKDAQHTTKVSNTDEASNGVVNNRVKEFLILGVFVCVGLSALGYFIASSPAKFKQYERSVNVKGLSEREVVADVVIWPIKRHRGTVPVLGEGQCGHPGVSCSQRIPGVRHYRRVTVGD